MRFPRRSGILLHPTSLPGRFGIGDMGPEAYRFIDWLQASGQSLWQVLPLGPTGYGDSPYQSFSSFAGNALVISPERLVEQGLLTGEDLDVVPEFPEGRVDYATVNTWKDQVLRKAFVTFQQSNRAGFAQWATENDDWLEDYALFMAIKEHFGGGPWKDWPAGIRERAASELERYREQLRDEIEFRKFLQFQFFQQWITLRAYAHSRGVAIIGDVPIFVAHDSADVWSHRDLFYINPDGTLQVQAGVPPDYFSETGQLWGNPLFRWDVLASRGYDWWIERFRSILKLVDVVRLDHFRGFAGYWEIPGEAETAVSGRWQAGPGSALFHALREELGSLQIIAENLGVITPDVEEMRLEFQYPGMRILQFAFTADTSSAFLPHSYEQNTVAYTGTHDNETTRGWFDGLSDETRQWVQDYFDTTSSNVVHAMVRAVIASVADTAVVPLQDVLDYGNEARMNLPGRAGGNWQWRVTAGELTRDRAAWLAHLVGLYGRSHTA
jgi:4-alpha-glucanotransferase